MKYQKTLSAIFLVLLFSFSCEKNPTQSVEYGEGDDYEIYQVVLMDCFSETEYLVILNDSTVLSCIDSFQTASFREQFPEIKDETITDFITQNEEKSRLKPIRDIDFYVFESEYEGTYRNTIRVILSPVGYDEAKTQVIVVMGEIFGPEDGEGILFFMIKEGGEWKVSDRFRLWIN